MPRNPGSKKHAHNARHENGLIGSEKKLQPKRSNGHLNGSVKAPIPTEPVPSSSSTETSVIPPPIDTTISNVVALKQLNAGRLSHPGILSRDSESDGGGQNNVDKATAANGTIMSTQRRSDAGISKPKTTQDINAFQIASTILNSHPACDTVALLIVLLALPSLILTIVQALFASMTLMPGSGIITPLSFLSLFDVFQGSPGSPSVGTMAVVDFICFALWITLWPWAQNFALDLAQMQIAITLGNGTAIKSGGVNTACFAIVLVLHSVRSKGVRDFLTRRLLPTELLSETRVTEILRFLPNDADFGASPGSPSKIRSLFAIHIISQALMAFVRRRVAATQMAANKSGKRSDMESSTGALENGAADSTVTTAISSSVDYQPPPTPGLRESKDKPTSAKKRRRQANHVRSRQPFWSALASTKVHVARDLDHKKGTQNLTPSHIGSLDPARQNLAWITQIDSSEVYFESNFVFHYDPDEIPPKSVDGKPFFVRINGAKWQACNIDAAGEGPRTGGTQARWIGVIFGLAPNCTYTCSFNAVEDDEEIFSVMVKTPALLDKDPLSAVIPVPVHQLTRPSSPSTTLKNSIASAEAKLNDARNRLTKARRQHKASLNRVERDIDNFNTRLKSASDDTKQRQKLLQAERSIKATEDATNTINAALEDFETIPEEENEDYAKSKKEFDEQSKLLAETNEDLTKTKSTAKNDLACVNNELSNLVSRKERLASRQTKLTEQYDRIMQANLQGVNEKERKADEAANRQADQQRREADLTTHVNNLADQLRDVQVRTHATWRQIESSEKQMIAQRDTLLSNSGPLTPEGDLPGTRPLNMTQSARPFAFGSFQTLPYGNPIGETQPSPFLAYAKTLPSDGRRPRSNTNRSAISNLSADFEDADPIPPMPTTMDYHDESRKGSGSSRGQNNGSPAGGVGAGVIGDLRSPQKKTQSPGHMPGSSTW